MKKVALIFILFASACTTSSKINGPGLLAANPGVDVKLMATAFQQRAAEYRALCFQAYNIAHEKVDDIVKSNTIKPKAIITDIDETVLDNSPYEAHQVLQGRDYEASSWAAWTAMASADTVPGSFSFFKYASSKGIEIFYVTNRSEDERAVTLKNLKKFNFPNADDAHIFLRQNASSKEPRRKNIEADHSIVMLLGDNLGDFSFLFDVKNSEQRMQNVNNVAAEFGSRFIILPNFVYGDWEASLYNFNYSLTQAQKDSVIKSALITY